MDSFTLFHTAISLLAIAAGAVAITAILRNRVSRLWTQAFLVLAVATSVTGFFFPFKGVTPAQIVGVIALLILAVVLLAAYRFHQARSWRLIYATGLVASLYLLVFVGVVQAFGKIAVLKGLAPTGTELPFALAQGAALLLFVALGIVAARCYRPDLRGQPGRMVQN